jgi:hypothetical protein
MDVCQNVCGPHNVETWFHLETMMSVQSQDSHVMLTTDFVLLNNTMTTVANSARYIVLQVGL